MHQLQDILLLKTQIIIKALQHEMDFSLAQILEVVLNFTYRLHMFLDLLSIKNIQWGLKHTLTLVRGDDTQALYRNAAAPDGKVDIIEISWYMPQIQITPEYLTAMRTLIEQKITLPLAFRARTSEQTILNQTLA